MGAMQSDLSRQLDTRDTYGDRRAKPINLMDFKQADY